MKKSIFSIMYVILCCMSPYCEAKYVRLGTRASNCMYGVTQYIKKSNMLSHDLQDACKEHPEKCEAIGLAIMNLIFLTTLRVNTQLVDSAEEKLVNGNAQLDDFINAAKELFCYGEAILLDNELKIIEPVYNPAPWLRSPFEGIFTPALDKVSQEIRFLGKQMQWDDAKINNEEKTVIKNIISFIDSYAQQENQTTLLLSKALQDKHIHYSEENKKLTDELLKERTLNQTQQKELEKTQESLKKAHIDYEILKNSKPPLISDKVLIIGSFLSSFLICSVGIQLYNSVK